MPSPDELAARISEAKTSANLLVQFVQSTPITELSDNELMKEFYDRCRSAARSVQSYIQATNPAPDEDTLTTLIETNDELSVALSRYHNAILKARKAAGRNNESSPDPSSGSVSTSGAGGPPAPPPRSNDQSPPAQPLIPELEPAPAPVPATTSMAPPLAASAPTPAASGDVRSAANGPGRYEYRSEDFQVQNPFADNFATDTAAQQTGGGAESWNNTQRMDRTVM